MKRDMDLVREILLKVEAASKPPRMSELGLPDDRQNGQFKSVLASHVGMLIEEPSFLHGIDTSSNDGASWMELELTSLGHEFLDDVRDPEVWRMAKQEAKKAGGGGLEFHWKLAKRSMKAKLKKHADADL